MPTHLSLQDVARLFLAFNCLIDTAAAVGTVPCGGDEQLAAAQQAVLESLTAMQSTFAQRMQTTTDAQRNTFLHHQQAVERHTAQLGQALLAWWRRPEAQPEQQLKLAQAAATRSCAYLRCGNLGGEGGPAAGQGVGSMRCRWVDWRGAAD